MGKASKWIRSFLLGKKDEKCKKIDRLLPAESLGTPQVILSSSAPKGKRRWSFKRLGNADAIVVTHKRTGSFDSSFTNTQLVKQGLLDCEIEQIRGIITGNSSAGVVVKTASPATFPETGIEDAAATKIQAMFRSYLARRALRALRGLVKIQALVRGYLVRKKTTETIRCMHALMAIQIRARVQRVQIPDEAQTVGKRGSIYRESSKDYQFITAYNDKMNLKINESDGASMRKTGDMNELQAARTEDEFNFSTGIPRASYTGLPFMYHSGHHSISKDEHFQQGCPSPSTALADYDRQVAEFSINMPHRISQHNSKVSKTKQTKVPFSQPYTQNSNSTLWDCHFAPTYMSKTESSRAKARSKSEPKQRPKWEIKQKSKRATSIESMYVNHVEREKQHPWLIKLHQAARSSTDSMCSTTGIILNSSSFRNLNSSS